jgi:hypothetical protein
MAYFLVAEPFPTDITLDRFSSNPVIFRHAMAKTLAGMAADGSHIMFDSCTAIFLPTLRSRNLKVRSTPVDAWWNKRRSPIGYPGNFLGFCDFYCSVYD